MVEGGNLECDWRVTQPLEINTNAVGRRRWLILARGVANESSSNVVSDAVLKILIRPIFFRIMEPNRRLQFRLHSGENSQNLDTV